MQFIDTHIHLQDFKADFAPLVLENSSVKKLVLVSAKEDDYEKIANLVRQYPNKLIPAFGVHPWYAREPFNDDKLRRYLKLFSNALVGEIGVDGLREKPNEAQHKLFQNELQIAKEFNRPVIIHAARAFADLICYEKQLKEVRFVYHGFVKNQELIKFINKCGGYFGLGAHFVKQEKISLMWKEFPLDKVLFETDAPYQVNEECYADRVEENLNKLAKISGLSLQNLTEQFRLNTEEFLRC